MIDPLDHQKLLWTIAKRFSRKFHGTGFDLDDLVGWGQIGLLKACRTYNPKLGWKFSTWATPVIKKSIIRKVNNEGVPLRIPEYLQNLIRKGVKTHPNPKTNARLREAYLFLQRGATVETQLGVPLAAIVLQRNSEQGEKREAANQVDAILSKLPEEDASMIRRIYGIGCDRERHSKIADELGVRHQWVQKAELRILNQIREGFDQDPISKRPYRWSGVPKELPPCGRCGTKEGYTNPRAKRPVRKSGIAFGVSGMLCSNCYDHIRRQSKQRRAG